MNLNDLLQYKIIRNSYDTLSLVHLSPLLKGTFLPFSNSSMRPFNITCIINDILLNKRRNILEFGSGLSTIIIARLINQQNLNSKICTIENSEHWIEFINTIITKEGLEDIVTIIHAPLVDSEYSINNNQWYDAKSMSKSINEGVRFDMVIIDGPPAWEPGKKEARYPALPYVKDRLAENCSIYLDDAEREGERLIVKKSEEELGIKFKVSGGTLAYYFRGNLLNPLVEK